MENHKLKNLLVINNDGNVIKTNDEKLIMVKEINIDLIKKRLSDSNSDRRSFVRYQLESQDGCSSPENQLQSPALQNQAIPHITAGTGPYSNAARGKGD